MTETPEQPTPEQTDAEPQTTDVTAPAEPLYGADDVGRALETSGQRALAQGYFAKLGKQGITKAEADAMVEAIKTGQPYPPPEPPVEPEEEVATQQTDEPAEPEQQPAPPEGGAA